MEGRLGQSRNQWRRRKFALGEWDFKKTGSLTELNYFKHIRDTSVGGWSLRDETTVVVVLEKHFPNISRPGTRLMEAQEGRD